MKLNNYITLALAAVVTLASCQKEVGDGLSDQNKGKAKPEAAVTVVSAVDDTLTFSVSATGAEVSQYGWVVFEGTDNEAPAPLDIVIDEVSGSYASGVFDAADGMTGTASIEVEPYGEYQIFVAAITKTGLVGEVASTNVVVGDETVPELEEYDSEDDAAVMYLFMSEDVEYVESKEIVATLYAGYYTLDGDTPVFIYAGAGMAMGTAKAEVSIEDNVVTLDFGEQIPGTLYSVDIPDGAFVDMSGNEAAGVTSTVAYDAAAGENEFDGLIALVEQSTFEVEPAAEIPATLLVKEWNQWFFFTTPQYLNGGSGKGKAVYTSANGKTKTTREVEMTGGIEFGVTALTTIGVKLPAEPVAGESVTVTIPEGVIKDVYGNENEEITFGPILFMGEPFAIDITVDDVIYNGAVATFSPNNEDITYYYSYMPAEDVEGMTGEEIYASDLAYWESRYGTSYSRYGYDSFEELFIDNFCMTGEYEMDMSGDLDPETGYVVYACAVKNDLSMDSELFTAEFTTPAKPGASPEYSAMLGTYGCGAYDYFGEAPANFYMVVTENVVNESYSICFPGSDFCPESGSYIDYFTAAFSQESNVFAIVNNSLGSEGISWNFGSLGTCGIALQFFYYEDEADIEGVIFSPDDDGNLSIVYPQIPDGDYICFQSGIYNADGPTEYANGIMVLAGGPYFTKLAAPSSVAAPAAISHESGRAARVHLKNAQYTAHKVEIR